ncbi:beach-domain-containing protein [Rickenella mellea]|uniref:Beach-domain-containing protein n=1 Tax=Rickenella mellea TaxID=50990 RepID=A0A4Y7PWX8_9AGAM|nr:beach-domain-containing protein [Rickenella mellea]
MLGRLITPLRARFDISPSPRPELPTHGHGHQQQQGQEEEADAENFARDVLIELMRNSLDGIKCAEGLTARLEVMEEMHRIMVQDACTKDVFRELDGYVLLVNVLSILHASLDAPPPPPPPCNTTSTTTTPTASTTTTPTKASKSTTPTTPEGEILKRVLEGERLAFTIIAESITDHPQNRLFFETQVTYPALRQAITPLVKDPRTGVQTLGFLLGLSVGDFGVASLFSTTLFSSTLATTATAVTEDAMTKRERERERYLAVPSPSSTIAESEREGGGETDIPQLLDAVLKNSKGKGNGKGTIRNPEAFGLLVALAPLVPVPIPSAVPSHPSDNAEDSANERIMDLVYQITTHLATASHRNQCLLNALGIAGPLLHSQPQHQPQHHHPSQSRIWRDQNGSGQRQKQLVKRLLDMGVNTDIARELFRRCVLPSTTTISSSSPSSTTTTSATDADRKTAEEGRVELDAEALDLVRGLMKAKWPDHFSLEGSGCGLEVVVADDNGGRGGKGLPAGGFTFMIWMHVEHLPLPSAGSCGLFSASTSSQLATSSSGTGTGWGSGLTPSSAFFNTTSSATSASTSTFAGSSGNNGNNGNLLIQLSLRPDGYLGLASSGNTNNTDGKGKGKGMGNAAGKLEKLENARIQKGRWTHLALVHYPHRGSHSSIRIFVDGVLCESRQWAYPKPEARDAGAGVRYAVGDTGIGAGAGKKGEGEDVSWCIASAYMLSFPLPDDIPRLIHHLGPRYNANFQATDILRFLTYEASTSLNIFLSTIAASHSGSHFGVGTKTEAGIGAGADVATLVKAIKDGVNISEESFVFALSPNGSTTSSGRNEPRPTTRGLGEDSDLREPYVVNAVGHGTSRGVATIKGDVVVVNVLCLDVALWSVGGVAVALRLVELASTPHEMSRTLSVLTDAIRGCWQNSEDMERLRGYDILAHILQRKRHIINMTSYEVLFEFMGINFRTPDQSTIVNTLAYRTLALDLEIWSGTPTEIQRAHLDHFATLLKTSRYKAFNARQRIAKFGVVRKLLFVLQTAWYAQDVVRDVVAALKTVALACFSADETIKPMVSYLAANLHDESTAAASPRSTMSRIDWTHRREKAEDVLTALVSILSVPACMTKFTAALPLTRICLLLLGEHPSSRVTAQVLHLIALALKTSLSFNRKFELVSGWTILRVTLPSAWDREVQEAAFDVLLGRIHDSQKMEDGKAYTVTCPYILPAILSSLHHGLMSLPLTEDDSGNEADYSVEVLLEELLNLQSSNASFRQVFKSHSTTAIVIQAHKAFISSMTEQDATLIRVLEKMNHFLLSLALDKAVATSQKEEIMAIVQQADDILHSGLPTNTTTDSPVRPDRKSHGLLDSSRALLQLVGERAYQKTTTRIREWRKTIIASEQKRLRRTIVDLRENHRQAESFEEWRYGFSNERGIWSLDAALRRWSLDETEGPYRVRKKLEPRLEVASTTRVAQDGSRMVTEPDSDAQSIVQVEAPPWAESYEFTTTDSESDQWVDDFAEDKHRRVRHELQPGDVIEAVSTVTRIAGVDSSPGLLILGRHCLYMMDGLVENEDGEVVDVHDVPSDLLSVPGTLLELDGRQRARYWTYEQIGSLSKRTCLFRDVALEIYFKDSRNLLVVFASKKARHDISDKLSTAMALRAAAESKSPMLLRTPMFGRVSARVLSGSRDELGTAQRKWQAREISNFTYLSIINQTSGRTPGDATQYPVFPWVLADYTSESLDLTSPATFRDLSCPMGALTDARREAARSRYSNLQSVDEEPFHYGTHFSSSMIVCHFLIRLEPFTHMFKTLQGGDWDLPDRLFSDVSRSYHSASEDLRGDVRELIPEFYNCPEFLENGDNLDFGVQQNTGDKIHHVKLPPWAKRDPFLFIAEHRRALESDYVSEHLPAWVDLIWGCKQRDPESLNVFHPLSYEGSIDLDSIADPLERGATVGIIHNFGQTPRKIFQTPHPPRILSGPSTLPLGTLHGVEEDPHLLLQSPRPSSDLAMPVADLIVDVISERVLPCQKDILYVPQYPHEQIGWGFVDRSLRLFVDRKVAQVAESISCTCASFADSETFATGSRDCTVRLWLLKRKDSTTKMTQTHIMHGHTRPVVCISACRPWSIIVSGSEDGTAAIWDLNRATYVRSIWHEKDGAEGPTAVSLVAINASTGLIATCSSNTLCLHTINARQIVRLDMSQANPSQGIITSLAFHEREYSRVGILATGCRDGTITLRTWSATSTPPGETAQWKFVTLRSMRCREGANGHSPEVTALKFVGESLFHGEDTGKVYSWDLPD